MKLLGRKNNHYIVNSLSLKIAGEAGQGIATSGTLFSKLCTRGGLDIHGYAEYPSLIRGGHNTFQLTINDQPVLAPTKSIQLLIALNKESITKHIFELSNKALVMYDPDENDIAEAYKNKKNLILCPVPFAILAKDAGADRLMRNTVALGASIAVLDYDIELLNTLFNELFQKKGDAVIQLNIQTAKSGYDYIKEHFDNTHYPYRLSKIEGEIEHKLVLSGNEAIGLGAIKAGVTFYAGYPMTPSSSLLHYMAAHQIDLGIVVKQTEDEISAANMAIGAWHTGIRAMTATSGGGFALMSESLGLAAITETPMVYMVAQRPGPATGLPTWTDQSDLEFVLHASQGEFPRIVVAPADVQEAFYVSFQSFNIAETYQLPVIILSDKYLSESPRSTAVFNTQQLKIERGNLPINPCLMKAEYTRGMIDKLPMVYPRDQFQE